MILLPHPNKNFMAKFDRYETIYQDHSAMDYLKKCDRQYFYRIVLGRVPQMQKNQTVLDFGTAYHKFKEVLERTKDIKDAIGAAKNVKIQEPELGSKWEFLTGSRLMKVMAIAYQAWEREKQLGKIEVIDVEMFWNVMLSDGTYVAGRMDQLVKWGGQIWNRDWKTSTKQITYFQSGTEPNDQVDRYNFGGSNLISAPLGGTIFDVMYHTKTVEPTITPVLATRTKSQIETWVKEQIHINTHLKSNRELDIWPKRETSCYMCDYKSVCRKPTEASQMAELESRFKLSPWDCTTTEQKEISE